MKLSQTVIYAIRATLQLAETNSNGPVPCSRLAADGDMPERFLLQILRSLVKHGILQSTRGVDGGYSLNRSPDEISLLEVIEAIEGPLVDRSGLVGSPQTASHQRLESVLLEVSKTARKQLQAIKLSQIMQPAY